MWVYSVHVLISVEMLSSAVQIFHNSAKLYISDYAPVLQQHWENKVQ